MSLTPELQQFLEEALTLKPISGHHLHPADGFMANPPPPGHRDWLPIIEALSEELLATGDDWVIGYPLGFTDEFVRPPDDLDELFSISDPSLLREPPSVQRFTGDFGWGDWEGEYAMVRRRIAPGVIEGFTIDRDVRDRDESPFDVRVSRLLLGSERKP